MLLLPACLPARMHACVRAWFALSPLVRLLLFLLPPSPLPGRVRCLPLVSATAAAAAAPAFLPGCLLARRPGVRPSFLRVRSIQSEELNGYWSKMPSRLPPFLKPWPRRTSLVLSPCRSLVALLLSLRRACRAGRSPGRPFFLLRPNGPRFTAARRCCCGCRFRRSPLSLCSELKFRKRTKEGKRGRNTQG